MTATYLSRDQMEAVSCCVLLLFEVLLSSIIVSMLKLDTHHLHSPRLGDLQAYDRMGPYHRPSAVPENALSWNSRRALTTLTD